LFSLCVAAVAQQKPAIDEKMEQARIERLAGLAKVWGAAKYFHPYLAFRDVNWDKALLESVPLANAATTPQEYKASIEHLLSYLNDKNTYAFTADVAKAPALPATEDREFMRLENGIVFIEPALAAVAHSKKPDPYYESLQKNFTLLAQAKAVVIDARCERAGYSEGLEDYFNEFLNQVLPRLVHGVVPLSTYRYRIHNGYAPQVGGSSGGYYSAVVNTSPEAIAGRNPSEMPPTVFLYDDRSPLSATTMGGLRTANKVSFVKEGDDAFEIGLPSYQITLPEGVTVKMRTAELVNADGSTGFHPDQSVATKAGADAAMKEALKFISGGQPTSTRSSNLSANTPQLVPRDDPYAGMEFPSTEYRLLGLFRFWNVINYFYPYKDLIGGNWDDVLVRYIPKFEADKDALEYQTTAREMVTEIHDSHGFVRGTTKIDEKLGNFVIPVMTSYIEGQSVVTKVLDDKLGVKVGDIVLAIDGEPIEQRRQYFARIFAASTPQSFNSQTTSFHMMRRPQEGPAKLTLKGADGRVSDVEIPKLLSIRDPKIDGMFHRSTPVFQVLPTGFGYVDLDRLPLADVDKMFETIKDTPATIFDMRGYPNGTAWAIAPRLTTKKNVVGALFSRPIVEATDIGSGWLINPSYTFTQAIPAAKGDIYTGKVVMLIDGNAISQSEHTCLFFESATEVTFVGTPTAGANGDVTNLVLPGNIIVNFSGHNVRHPDGRQLQRVGIQPTIRAEPTVRGVVEGRDEILLAAVNFLRSGKLARQEKK
jgi:hypothetical protein